MWHLLLVASAFAQGPYRYLEPRKAPEFFDLGGCDRVAHVLAGRMAGDTKLLRSGLKSEFQNSYSESPKEISLQHLPQLVPPELLALSFRNSWRLAFKDGKLAGVEMDPVSFLVYQKGLGAALPRSVTKLKLTASNRPPTSVELLACEWLSQVRELTLSSYDSAHSTFKRGDLRRLLQNERLRNLRELELEPLDPRDLEELSHPTIEILTLHRQMGGSYPWASFISEVKSKFPKLTVLRIPENSVPPGASPSLRGRQAEAISSPGFKIEFIRER